MVLTFLKSERAIDGLRWGVAFIAVVLAYGVAAWMLLRPTGWQLGVNGPVFEVNLSDLPQPSTVPPGDRASEPASPANLPSANAASDPSGSAENQQGSTAGRAAGGSAGRADAPAAARDAAAADAKDGSPDAAKTAALDKTENPAIATPRPPDDTAPEVPPKTEAPAADSGGGGRPTAASPRVATPDTSPASIARAPIDTSITVNQGRSLLRSAKGGPQFRGLPLPQLKLTPPLATVKEPLSRKPNPLAGLTLPAPGPTASAANYSHAQDLAQRPEIGADGGLARNAIGVVIERHAIVSPASTPLGVRPPAGAMSPSIAMHASSEQSSATTAVGASPAANNATRSNAGSTGAANRSQAGHPDQALQANHLASIGGPAIHGGGMNRLASSTGAVSGPAHIVAGALNGSSFRPKYR